MKGPDPEPALAVSHDRGAVRARTALWSELARFVLVGGVTNVLYFGLLWRFRTAHWSWWLASGSAYALSMVANYLMQRTFTFRSVRSHRKAGQRYLLVQIVGLEINSVLLEMLLGQRYLDGLLGPALSALIFALPPLPALPLRVVLGQGTALVATTIWSYIAQKFWVFERS